MWRVHGLSPTRHTGSILASAEACENPRYGIWGGPPDGAAPRPKAAQELAFADRTGSLGAFVAQDVPEIKFALNVPAPTPDTKDSSRRVGEGA